MLLVNDKLYIQTKNIILHKEKLDDYKKSFCDILKDKCNIDVINYEFNKLDGNANRYSLYLLINNEHDFNKLYKNPTSPIIKYKKQITKLFTQFVNSENVIDEIKPNNLFVGYNNFVRETMTENNWNASKEVENEIKIINKKVWKVITEFTNIVVFFNTEDSKNEYINKNSKEIELLYLSILKKYDEFNQYNEVNINVMFESKETLDENYEGNLFYYSKR